MTNPRQLAILLKNKDGAIVDQLQNRMPSLSWEWNRIGGCGGCNIKLKTDWDSSLAKNLKEDYEINIYAPDVSGTSALWYSGTIDRVRPSITGEDEFMNIFALGYVNQLKKAALDDKTFVSREISSIVKDMVEVEGTGITNVTSTAADYDATDFSCDSVYFNESLYESVAKMAEIAGRREWGVRADKSFFFFKREDGIKHYHNIKESFSKFQPTIDFNPVYTRIYLQGGNDYAQRFTITNKRSIKEKIVQNSSITTQSVGQQFGRMWLKENGKSKRGYTGTLIKQNTRLESTIPIGRASVNIKVGIKDLYDAGDFYDSGKYYDGGTEAFQMERIKYVLTDDDINVTIYYNAKPPSIADEFGKLEFMITNERNV